MILGLCLMSIVVVRAKEDNNEFIDDTGYDDLDLLDASNDHNVVDNDSDSRSLDTDIDITDVPPANIDIPHIDRSLPPAEGLLKMIEALQLGDKEKEYLRTNLLKKIELQKLLKKISTIDTDDDKIDEILPDGITINAIPHGDDTVKHQTVNIDSQSKEDALKVENHCGFGQMIILVSLAGAISFILGKYSYDPILGCN